MDYEAGDRTGKLPAMLPLNFKAFSDALKPKKVRKTEGGTNE
jgi:hypothetical protein